MPEDDFLIEEIHDLVPLEPLGTQEEEEEDLLADVGNSTLDRLHTWELDSQIPPIIPTAVTAMGNGPVSSASLQVQAPRTQEGSGVFAALAPSTPVVVDPPEAFETSTVPVAPGVRQAALAAVAALGPGKGKSILVVDPASNAHEASVLEPVLTRLGFVPRVVQTGPATREELSRGRCTTVLLRLDGEPTWAKVLVNTARQRWPHLHFVATLPLGAEGHAASLRAAGIAQLIMEPLPGDAALMRALTPPPASAAAPPVTKAVVNPAVRLVAAETAPPAAPVEAPSALPPLPAVAGPAAAGDELMLAKALLTRHPYAVAVERAEKHFSKLVQSAAPSPDTERHLKNLRAVSTMLRKMEKRLGVTVPDANPR